MRFAGILLRKDNLGDVLNRLGKAHTEQSGDAADSQTSICYRVPNGVVELSSGELGGSENELYAFQLSAQSMTANCTRWPEKILVALQIGRIHIGLNRKQFMRTIDAHISLGRSDGNFDVFKRTRNQ